MRRSTSLALATMFAFHGSWLAAVPAAAAPFAGAADPGALYPSPAVTGPFARILAANDTAATVRVADRPGGFDAETRLLNGLLVPAFDVDVEPLRWVDPRRRIGCRQGSEILVDGHPLPVGEPVPLRPFVVDWTARGCRPFGSAGPRFDGFVRLFVERREHRLEADAVPIDLVVTTANGSSRPAATRRVSVVVGPGAAAASDAAGSDPEALPSMSAPEVQP